RAGRRPAGSSAQQPPAGSGSPATTTTTPSASSPRGDGVGTGAATPTAALERINRAGGSLAQWHLPSRTTRTSWDRACHSIRRPAGNSSASESRRHYPSTIAPAVGGAGRTRTPAGGQPSPTKKPGARPTP